MDAYNRADRKFLLMNGIRKRQAPPLTHCHPAIPPTSPLRGASEVGGLRGGVSAVMRAIMPNLHSPPCPQGAFKSMVGLPLTEELHSPFTCPSAFLLPCLAATNRTERVRRG